MIIHGLELKTQLLLWVCILHGRGVKGARTTVKQIDSSSRISTCIP